MSDAFRACAVVPTYDNPSTVRGVVDRIRGYDLEVIIVDDGSAAAGRAQCEEIARDGLALVEHLARNRGKGAAVKRGFAVARECGFTHAFQIDADGQHDLSRIPAFLEAARQQPEALVLGYPVYDESAPAVRRIGRRLTTFWVAVEVGSRTAIRDAMIGFRVYPLAAAAAVSRSAERMSFDIEIAVRMVRNGTETVNLPVSVRYPREDTGGVSHFRPLRDNLSFGLLHSRLCTAGCMQWLWRKAVRARR